MIRMKPTERAKTARMVLLFKNAVRGTWLYNSDLMKFSDAPRSVARRTGTVL